jgi:hypothetical protein
MNRIPLGAVLVVAVVLATATGCGGDDDGDDDGGDARQAARQSAAPNVEDQMLAYARCMREHGVNMPDPGNEDTGYSKPAGGAAALQAAQEACRKYAPAKMQGGPDNPAAHDSLVSLARCLRKNGVNVADPQPGEDLRLPPGSSRDSRTQELLKTCDKPGKGQAGGAR